MNKKVSTNKLAWIWVNLLGGAAVIGSYILGFLTRPDASTALWGGVPESIRPLYTAGMILAAAGYLTVFTYFLRADKWELRIGNWGGFSLLTGLYLLILVPSALWMPMSIWALASSSEALAWLVRLDLVLVGAGAIGVLLALLREKSGRSSAFHSLAVLGSAALCLQTVVMDAVIWSSLFRV
jgi:hypothetical protein